MAATAPRLFTTLIGVDELKTALARKPRQLLAVIDVGFDLADPAAGERDYQAGHLPGSHYLHLDRDLCGAKTGRNGRHPLPERAAFAATLGRLGITPATQVVALDRQGGMYAARLWWMLRWMGHAAVAVLDGGLPAWSAQGGELDTAVPTPASTATYALQPPLTRSIDAATLLGQLGRVALIDARAGERFRGEVEPLDAAAGHIPGALNRFFKDNLGADGCFKPAAELRQEFERLLGAQASKANMAGVASIVHQCGSGVTACHNLLAMEHAGLRGAALYPGSWSEWSSDPSRPVAKG